MRYNILLAMLVACIAISGQEPVKIDVRNSASYRWLNKTVLDSTILDDMEGTRQWVPFTTGGISVVDARTNTRITESKNIVADISYSDKKPHSGNRSLRLKLPSRLSVPGPESGRGWGTAGIWHYFESEDWNKYNRISLWIYPECPGSYQNWLEIRLFNEGQEKLPAPFGQEGETTVNLNNFEWNHVVWEISNVARDKVSKIEISSYMAGNEPEAADTLVYFFDDLTLQKVDPDYIEGWNVWPGRISFSHTGYLPEAPKIAVANDLKANEFSIIDEKSGKTVLTRPVTAVKSNLGTFQLLDFSELKQSGLYLIKAGETYTQPFRIDADIWEQTIRKALNFFYAERCGTPIPGVHGACHRDWTCKHGDKSIVINGGWHDAGDFTQGLRNTGEAVYAMFSLADQILKKGDNPGLYERLLEEAQWGLDWILKTSFGDGYRNEGSVNSRRTNGIIGDSDDVISTAGNTPKSNFIASAAEAIAYRVLRIRDPRLADYSLKMARSDWQFAIEKLILDDEYAMKPMWSGTFDSGNVLLEVASAGILSSVELWYATGDQSYADKAVDLAKVITGSQQRGLPGWDIPLTGFFYINPAKNSILHYCHNGRENEPVAALTKLCETFPDHPDWMKWYSAVVLHSEYLKKIAGYTEPYGIIPASVYTDEEYISVPESRRDSFRKQVLNGINLGKGHYLRIFPVWMDYRGHFGVILPQAQALSCAAKLRGDRESFDLALNQLEWIAGRNPFSQCTMYGEGYDYPPLYTPSSGDIVGALPVGIQTRAENDIPYWPVQSTWTYKEVWVHPVSQWLGVMAWLTEIKNIKSGTIQTNNPAPRSEDIFNFEVSGASSDNGFVTITARTNGKGNHKLSVRTDNLSIKYPVKNIFLKPGETMMLRWKGKMNATDEPWVAVIVPDDNFSNRKELTGAAGGKQVINKKSR
ncbi:MAG: glycoside hydrolase family 9 protein [Bacteroidota bacterium]|nr:glycoside hydrolase family 9 protein [Bacteroidota bacterium]